MNALSKQHLYRLGGGATVTITSAFFASPFILVALYLIDRALG